MALIQKPKETATYVDQQYVKKPAAQQTVPYSGLQGLTEPTQKNLGKYQQGYQPSDTVLDAQNRLANVQRQKPQGYDSKYSATLDGILAQIQNPEEFKYSFDGDELFKMYADMYTRKGQLGMMDAIGNASALTGGYGNSYAQQVGQQTFDEYMNDLYGIGMDLRDRAYDQYKDRRNDLYNQYGVLSQADQTDYGRYRDLVGDWQNELNYWTNQAANERAFDYNTYADMLNYWQNQAAAENADYWNTTNFNEGVRQYDTSLAENMRQYNESLAENIRQFNESLDWDKLSTEQKNALNNAQMMLQMGLAPSLETLTKAGFTAAEAQAIIGLLTPAVEAEQMPQNITVNVTGGGPSGGNYTPGDIAKMAGMYMGNAVGTGVANAAGNAGNQVSKQIAQQQGKQLQQKVGTIPYKDYVFGSNGFAGVSDIRNPNGPKLDTNLRKKNGK